jgi:diguanylate cyclase (GGDEF)-like protein
MTAETMNERLVWLLTLSRNMLATREVEQLLRLITDAFLELTDSDRAFLMLREPGRHDLNCRMGRSSDGSAVAEPKGKAIRAACDRAVQSKELVLATVTAASASERRWLTELERDLIVCVPLVGDSDATGVLYGDAREAPDGLFTDTQRRTCEMLADHAAAAIENARMFERATNDPLTGLPNSSHFLHQLAKAMREATAAQQTGILLVDLDRFKRINTSVGAEMGDRALVDVAATLQEVLRADGLVARYSSDKFAVLLPPELGRVELRLHDVAERARAAISTKNYYGIQMSASIGGVGFPGPSIQSAPDLVALADDCLGKARVRGQGEVEIA